MNERAIVLDANIIIRGVLGKKVYLLLEQNFLHIKFYVPEICFVEAQKHLPVICKKRTISTEQALMTLQSLCNFFDIVENFHYDSYEKEAKARIEVRDINDWPIIATAMLYQCPIWTEDNDFFGTGIANWTTDRVHLYLLA